MPRFKFVGPSTNDQICSPPEPWRPKKAKRSFEAAMKQRLEDLALQVYGDGATYIAEAGPVCSDSEDPEHPAQPIGDVYNARIIQTSRSGPSRVVLEVENEADNLVAYGGLEARLGKKLETKLASSLVAGSKRRMLKKRKIMESIERDVTPVPSQSLHPHRLGTRNNPMVLSSPPPQNEPIGTPKTQSSESDGSSPVTVVKRRHLRVTQRASRREHTAPPILASTRITRRRVRSPTEVDG